MKKIKIGIPRALLYHKYHVLWESFFKNLGCNVIISPETNKEILNKGLSVSVDESCLSVKLFLGHVAEIKDKVDYVFVPRIASLHRNEQSCVKFHALYDIVNNTFKNINLIDYNIDVMRNRYGAFAFIKLGLKISKNPFKSINAYIKAKRKYMQTHNKLIKEQEKRVNRKDGKIKILVVSHPYTTYDGLLGRPIIKFLESQGASLIYSDLIESKLSRKLSKNLSDTIYWTYNKEFLGAIEKYRKKIDGILFLSTFPCGPDALVVDLCKKR
jgi:predicted nucleotide-binding protein (sugar kinase/HSP70/actin superfamily)